MISLTRLNSGLLYGRDVLINPFVVGDELHWDKAESYFQISIVSGKLKIYVNTGTDTPAKAHRNNQINDRQKSYSYVKINAPTTYYHTKVGISHHIGDIGYPQRDGVEYDWFTYRAQTASLKEVINSSSTILDPLIVNSAPPNTYCFWMYSDEKNIEAYDSYKLTELSGTCNTLDVGKLGIIVGGIRTTSYIETFIAMSDRYVIVNNLYTGDTVEIRKSDNTVLVSANESGGSASIDLYKINIEICNKIVVVRFGVDIGVYTVSSGDFICGGDIYTLPIIADSLNNKKSYIIDAGVLYVNYGEKGEFKLGATKGGNQFGIDQNYRYMTFDGKRKSMVESQRITGVTPKIITNVVEFNYRLLNLIISGSEINEFSSEYNIKSKLKKLLESDYIKNITIVGEHIETNRLIIFKLLNTISIESLEFIFEKNDEMVIEIIFSGCYISNNLDYEPWEIDFINLN